VKVPKEICFVRANKTKFGGAEVYLSRLSSALNKKKIKHSILNSIFPNFLPSWLRAILFNFQACSSKKNKFYISLDRITCPDIYRAGDGVHKAFLKIENKSKLNPLHPVYLYIERRCFKKAKKIIAISNMVKNDIVNNYNIDHEKISVVYNGIDIKKIDHKRSFNRLKKEFSLRVHQKILLYVGGGFKRKGVEDFLTIISKLKNKNIKAFIIGKEKKIEYYKQLSKNIGIDNKVVFTGAREDVDDFYTISDIFIFPTRYEPFGNVILESMNFGNAVFTTKQCGGGELLDDYFIMNNSKDFSIVDKIDQLLVDGDKLEKIKKNNRKTSNKFSIESNLEKTLEIIDSVNN